MLIWIQNIGNWLRVESRREGEKKNVSLVPEWTVIWTAEVENDEKENFCLGLGILS